MIKLVQNEINLEIELPFFANKQYLESKSNTYGWFVSDNLILPFIVFKELMFKRLVFTTEVIQIKNSSIQEEKYFLNEVINFIKINNLCDFIHKPQPSAVFRTYPDNCNAFTWGTYKIDIEPNFENMLKKLNKSQRNYVRKALREEVQIERTDNFDKIYSFCNETLSRQKIPLLICREEFQKQYDTFHPNNMFMFKAIYKNEIQGSLVVFIDKTNAYAEYAGSALSPKHGSLKLLHLTAMQYLSKNHNIQSYDFIGAIPDIIEGSKEAGIQKFKKEFGAQIYEGYQFSFIVNPIKYFLFNLCLKLSFMMRRIKYVDPVERYKKLSKSGLKVT
ncbi:MAG: hypothetical protein C0625_05525 [Arcobacter sp.]|nr:MAG: hypothetical protein C0625_05525 [Arcobacter sp.]